MTPAEELYWADSYQRPRALFRAMIHEPNHRARLELFLEHWCMCDAPWAWLFARELRYTLTIVPLKECLGGEEFDWFNSLPVEIPVFRGCERGRERGLSWTTDLKVAGEFAQGRRCTNRAPTLMTAVIPKHHVFGVFLDRQESEIVVDPHRLRRLRPYPGYVPPLVRGPLAVPEPA